MVKTLIKVDSLPTKEIEDEVKKVLTDHSYEMVIDKMGQDSLQFLVYSGNQKTLLHLMRMQHKPIFLELEANFALLKKKKKEEKNQNKSNQRNNLSGIWLKLLIFSFFASILAYPILYLDDTLRLIAIGSILILFALVTFYILYVYPFIQQQRFSSLNKLDEKIIRLTELAITDLRKSKIDPDRVIKCWNCFEDVRTESSFCENCGKAIDS